MFSENLFVWSISMKIFVGSLCVLTITALAACSGSKNNPTPPTPPTFPPAANKVDSSPHAAGLALCEDKESTYVKVEVVPQYEHKKGQVTRMVEKSGPSSRNVFLSLPGEEAPYYTEQEGILNAWRKTSQDKDTICTRYESKKTVDGKSASSSSCLVYNCTFIERQE
jgi:hypothetical protein